MVAMLTDPAILLPAFVMIAVLATFYTLAAPYFDRGDLDKRMKAVALEREQMRARERARLNAEAVQSKASLRAQHNTSVRQVVERLNLREALVDANTMNRLRQAGHRSQNALNIFLFARFVLPFVFVSIAAFYIFYLGFLGDKPLPMRILATIAAAYLGFYAPNIYISNQVTKRQKSIRRAWPDALDLMLICVESGISIEVAFKRVADEIAMASSELAEELVLTTAELSFLQERRQAYENLGSHRARYGPLGHAGAHPGRTLRHAARPGAARLGAGMPRPAHERGGEEGRRPAAQADRADDPVLPAGADRRHPRPRRHPGRRYVLIESRAPQENAPVDGIGRGVGVLGGTLGKGTRDQLVLPLSSAASFLQAFCWVSMERR